MATGDVLALTVPATGWSLIPELDYTATGGTYNVGSGTGNPLDPSGDWDADALVRLSIPSPGYDVNGDPTVVDREVFGTRMVRKVYPDEADIDEWLNGGGKLETKLALSDFIYSNETSILCDMAAAFANVSGTPSEPITAAAVTNSSALVSPRVILRPLTVPYQTFAGSFDIVFVVDHAYARNRYPVPRLLVTASDVADGGSATVAVVATYTKKTFTASGLSIGVYSATFDAADFGQAKTIRVTAKASPWVGPSAAIVDTDVVEDCLIEDLGPGVFIGPLYFVCDKDNALTSWASVDGVGAGTPTVQATAALARTTPYANIAAALSALKAYNNSTHSDDSLNNCRVLMQNGTYTGPGSFTGSNTKSFCVIEADTANGATRAGVVFDTATNAPCSAYIAFRNVSFVSSGIGMFVGSQSGVLWLDSCYLDLSGWVLVYDWAAVYGTNNEIERFDGGFDLFSTYRQPAVVLAGNNSVAQVPAVAVLNVCNRNFTAGLFGAGNAPGIPVSDNSIVGWNENLYSPDGAPWSGERYNHAAPRAATAQAGASASITLDASASASDHTYNGQILEITGGTGSGQRRVIVGYAGSSKVATVHKAWTTNPDNTSAFSIAPDGLIVHGASWIGFVVARPSGTTSPLLQLAADGSVDGSGIQNVLVSHYTTAGSRFNADYNDTGSNSPLRTVGRHRFTLPYLINIKNDLFDGGNGARIGNQAADYRTGHVGNIAQGTNGFPPEYLGRYGSVTAAIAFADDQSTTGGGNGGGDYAATGDNENQVPAGQAVMGWDLYGTAYRNNGTDAAGAINTGGETPPTIDHIYPTTAARGNNSVDLSIFGADFVDGATVEITGDGITITAQAFVNSGQIDIDFDVALDATLSARTISVINPDTQEGSLNDALTVVAAPPPANPAKWLYMPKNVPDDAATVWVRTTPYFSAPFLAVWNESTQEFTTVSASLIIPWWAASQWREQ